MKRQKDKKHLQWVTQQKCLIHKAGFHSCNGVIQAHHLLKPSSKYRGFGLKAHDSEVIPLCQFHHQQLHTKFGNEFKFFEHYGLSKFIGQETAKKLYDKKSIVIDNDDLPF